MWDIFDTHKSLKIRPSKQQCTAEHTLIAETLRNNLFGRLSKDAGQPEVESSKHIKRKKVSLSVEERHSKTSA